MGSLSWRSYANERQFDCRRGEGAVAGAAGTWVMTQVTTWTHDRENEAATKREDAARAGSTAYARAAGRASQAIDTNLSDEQRSQAGTAIHWATGIAADAAYAVVRKRWPRAAAARGLPFGAGFFMMVDDLLNPVLGLTPGPLAFPWQTHARGLGGHLAFGLATELVLEGLDRAV